MGTIIDITLSICSVIASGAMTFFAVSAWFTLRRVSADVLELEKATGKMYAIVSVLKIQMSFNQLNDLKEVFNELISAEQFEEAAKLKAVIENEERQILREIEQCQKTCGEHVEMEMVRFKKD